ncbi:MAG TPA: DUF3500 domain-containing protein, partial [Chthonomonadaceae bacterium]|nr:DUF3500 domain-containing protein [Chthonomonadaceae bacterium]
MLNRRDLIVGGAVAATGALAVPAAARQRRPTLCQTAKAFLAALDAEQKAKAQFPFNSEERMNWHYVPMERKGLHYKAMTPEQQTAAHAMLLVSLSKSGYRKIEAIRQLELVLREVEQGKGPTRDPDLYYFA